MSYLMSYKGKEVPFCIALLVGCIALLAPLVSRAAPLFVTLTALPSSGVEVVGVDLIAQVAGSASGELLTYRFDCTSDGTFEGSFVTTSQTYTIENLCDYLERGAYQARVQVEQGSAVAVTSLGISIEKKGTFEISHALRVPGGSWQKTVQAQAGQKVEFRTQITGKGDLPSRRVFVRDELPLHFVPTGRATLNGTALSQDIRIGVEIPEIAPGQTVTLDFEAQAPGSSQLSLGTSKFINVIIAYNAQKALTNVATVMMERKVIAALPSKKPVAKIEPLPQTQVFQLPDLQVKAISVPPQKMLILANLAKEVEPEVKYLGDCDTDQGSGWDKSEFDKESTGFRMLCTYETPGTYTAKIAAEAKGSVKEQEIQLEIPQVAASAKDGSGILGKLRMFGASVASGTRQNLFGTLLVLLAAAVLVAFLLADPERVRKVVYKIRRRYIDTRTSFVGLLERRKYERNNEGFPSL